MHPIVPGGPSCRTCRYRSPHQSRVVRGQRRVAGRRRGRRAGEHDPRPRPARAGQPRGRRRDRGGRPGARRRARHRRGARRPRPGRAVGGRAGPGVRGRAGEAVGARPRGRGRACAATVRRRWPRRPRSRSAVGIPLFATGGLGGVHRGARDSWDVSADLGALARTGVLVVCSGVKSILDVPATLEVLETSSVPVLGYGTDVFPGFYRRDAGLPVPWRVDTPAEVAAAWRAHVLLGGGAGMVLAQPVPADDELAARSARPAARRRAGDARRARGHRQGRDARAARALPRGQRRRQPGRQPRAGGGERRARRAGRGRGRRERVVGCGFSSSATWRSTSS